MRALTEKQAAILDYVAESIASLGYPPSLREIGAAFGIRSTNGVNDHLHALERKGYIERDRNSARGIRLVQRAASLDERLAAAYAKRDEAEAEIAAILAAQQQRESA